MTLERADISGFDLRHLPQAFYQDPFPWYRALRTYEPVHRCPDGSIFLTRYADCAAVYRDPRCSSDKRRTYTPGRPVCCTESAESSGSLLSNVWQVTFG